MFRVSSHLSSGVLKTVPAAFGTGHNTGTATSLQRGPIGLSTGNQDEVEVRSTSSWLPVGSIVGALYHKL